MKIIDPKTSRESQAYDDEPVEPPPPTRPPRPTRSRKTSQKKPRKSSEAREAARELAREKYGVPERSALTAAERQQRRRSRLVGVHFELEPEQAAKLIALAEASGTNQTAVIRDLIDQAKLH